MAGHMAASLPLLLHPALHWDGIGFQMKPWYTRQLLVDMFASSLLHKKRHRQQVSKRSRARGAAPCGRGPARPCGLADWLTGALSAKSNQKDDKKRSRARGAAPCGRGPARPCGLADWLTGALSAKSNQKEDSKCWPRAPMLPG